MDAPEVKFCWISLKMGEMPSLDLPPVLDMYENNNTNHNFTGGQNDDGQINRAL